MTQQTETPLNELQLNLLVAVASGLTAREAAEQLYITKESAWNVLSAARRAAGAGTTEHLVVIALHQGWLELDDEGCVSLAVHSE